MVVSLRATRQSRWQTVLDTVLTAVSVGGAGAALFATSATAQDATWNNPATIAGPTAGTFDFNAGANWSGGAVPTGIASFGTSTTPAISFAGGATVGGWTFTSAAPAYAFTLNSLLTFNGTGIAVSGGSATITADPGGAFMFQNSSTAGSATIIINNGAGGGFYNTSTAGTASITNNAGGTLLFGNSATAGSATITNSGSLAFYNTSTAGNATLINDLGGKIDFSVSASAGVTAGSIAGAGQLFLGAVALTVGGNNASTGYSGNISDCDAGGCINSGVSNGSLVKVGTGTLTLAEGNLYTGGTTFAGGVVSVSANSALGDNAGGLTFNGGTLKITDTNFNSTSRAITWGAGGGGFDIDDALNIFEVGQTLTGTGGLTKLGAGTLQITGITGYSGDTNVLAGTLQVAGAGTLSADSNYNVAAGATLDLNDTIQGIGSLSGGGTVTNSGAGLSRVITGLNNGSAIFSGVIQDGPAGTVQVWVDGTGTTTFTGTNTYTGGTAICFCSVLQLGNNTATGSIVGDVTNGGTLEFKRSNAYTFAGIISDSGGDAGKVVQSGTGNTILTGTSTYTGTTTVNAGILSVNGDISSSSGLTVNAGGTLGGDGIVGATFINGGNLAPGNSIGLLTMHGNLVLTAASSYMVEVSPSAADRVDVVGSADLGGATVRTSFAPGVYIVKQYTILNATLGLGGTTFGGIANTGLPAGFQTSLSYDANNVYLNLSIGFGLPGGLNINQQNVANALTGYFNRTGGIPAVFGSLMPQGLTQVSGETATGAQQATFDAMNLFLGLLTDPTLSGRGDVFAAPGAAGSADVGDALAYAGPRGKGSERDAFGMMTKAMPRTANFESRWNVWGAGFGGSRSTDGHAALGSNTAASRAYGFAVGADYLLSPQTIAGFALSGGGTSFSVAGAGSGRSDLFQAGAYARHTTGSAYVTAAVAYGWQDITTDRIVTVASTDQLRARFNANAFSGRVEGGTRYRLPWMGGIGVTPYAAAQVTALDLPAYAEAAVGGANTFALAFWARTAVASRTELGVRADRSYAVQDAILTLRGRAAWAHDYNPNRTMAASFLTLPGASFVVNGAAQAGDAALTTASAEMKFSGGLSLAATFEGEFSQVTRSYAGKSVARYTW